jgi:hypothetical protein
MATGRIAPGAWLNCLAAARAFGLMSGDGTRVVAVAAVDAPSTAVGNASDFLNVKVDHMAQAYGR